MVLFNSTLNHFFFFLSSWDDSSSVSSGISDTIDTDDINTSSSISSYANTPAAQRKALNGQVSVEARRAHTHTLTHTHTYSARL